MARINSAHPYGLYHSELSIDGAFSLPLVSAALKFTCSILLTYRDQLCLDDAGV